MADNAVQVTRGARIPGNVRRLAVRVGDMSDTNREVANKMVRLARDAAPSRTGELAGSLRVMTANRGGLEVGSSKVYAGVIHWGWPRRHISPNPFLTDALTAARVVETYEDDIDELLRYI